MLEFLQFRTWEFTLLLFAIFIIWGILSERSRRKTRRYKRGDIQKAARHILLQSGSQPSLGSSGHLLNTNQWGKAGSYDSNPVLPLTGDPADTNDRYVVAALGMESNRQDFYRQAWEASHNNEFL